MCTYFPSSISRLLSLITSSCGKYMSRVIQFCYVFRIVLLFPSTCIFTLSWHWKNQSSNFFKLFQFKTARNTVNSWKSSNHFSWRTPVFLVKEKILCTSDGDLTIEVKFRKIQIHDSEFLDILAKHKYCIFILNILYIYAHICKTRI